MTGDISGETLSIAQKSLDALWLKQKVISSNIANIDTPGYKSRAVKFEELLKSALKRTASGAGRDSILDRLKPEVVKRTGTQAREDGNNVDIDAENVELVRTQLQYEFMTRALSDEMSRLKYAITEGRG
jgi:flagellar basal-body rod protein FlgB